MNNTIIYLIGHYGVGKLTIAKAICAAAELRLFDNHLANNVIFSLIKADGKSALPERVWDLIDIIRDQAVMAIEELTPPEASFVFTNCLFEGIPSDRATFEQVKQLAMRRASAFVPVLLTASDDAHAMRLPSIDRAERLKVTDVDAATSTRRAYELLRIDDPNRLDLDTTDLPPAEAAQKILAHVTRCI